VPRSKSITSRITFLHVVAVIVTAIVMPLVLYWFFSSAVKTLHNQSMGEQAEWLSRHLHTNADGGLLLDLPEGLRDLFSISYGRYTYAVLDEDGHVLFSSRPDRTALFPLQQGTASTTFDEVSENDKTISGASIRKVYGGRGIWIQFGEDLDHPEVLLDNVVSDFLHRVGWITIPILLLLLVTDIVIVRQALRPLLLASNQAMEISPKRIDVRLPIEGIPQEILPLVIAVNQALDRLELGFRRQREFTADVAHELRTPLAILRTRIDTLPDQTSTQALHHDIEGMSRVVSQLLDAAELDTLLIDPDEVTDLHGICIEVAEQVAPLAVAEERSISFSGDDGPVRVKGDAEMLRRAIRNLLENAIRHTPGGTAVELVLDAGGTVRVLDEGDGIPSGKQHLIFERFWRHEPGTSGGAGLGLSIVKRIVEAHGGTITFHNRPTGGAEFTLRLRLADAAA
jgi:signal transduction histidine kinase